jgi:hypothetical protein
LAQAFAAKRAESRAARQRVDDRLDPNELLTVVITVSPTAPPE